MDQINKGFLLGGAAVLLVFLLGAWAFNMQTPSGAPNTLPGNASPTMEQTGAVPGSPQSPSVQNTAPSVPKTSVTSKNTTGYSVSVPKADAQLTTGQTVIITWNKATNRTGGIELVEAKTGAAVGWVTPSLISSQTQYQWDVRDVLTSRTSPLRKDIGVGSYYLLFVFDGPNPPTFASNVFNVVYPNQVTVTSYTIAIANYALSPATTTVRQGETVVFKNNDSVSHQLWVGTFNSYTLAPGASQTFNTNVLGKGPYQLYDNAYSSVRGTLVVE